MELIYSTGILSGVLIYVGYLMTGLLKKTPSLFYRGYFIVFTLIHFSVAIGFITFLSELSTIQDPHDFYNRALEAESWMGLFGIGHDFMSFIIYPFVQLNIGIELFFLVFSVISYKGFLMLFELLEVHKFTNKSHLFLLSFFLIPSIHFWTVFLGKEPLLLFLMVLLLRNVVKNTFNIQMIGLLIIIFLIRPHVCLVLIIALLMLFLMDKSKSLIFKRNMLLIAFFVLSILGALFFLFFLKIETLSFSAFINYYKEFMEYTVAKGNTAISIADTTIVTRIFYLLMMPLPFLYPIKNNLILFISIENLFYVFIFLYMLRFFIKNKMEYLKLKQEVKFSFIASILLILLFGAYLYNIGLGNRMRIMFYPYLFYFFLTVEVLYHNKKAAVV